VAVQAATSSIRSREILTVELERNRLRERLEVFDGADQSPLAGALPDLSDKSDA
jgi:hypothetical protein